MKRLLACATTTAAALTLTGCIGGDPVPSAVASAEPTPAASATPVASAEPTPAVTEVPAAPHTVLMHDGVIQVELPEAFAYDATDLSWSDGISNVSCWAWRDPTIPATGTTAADINWTWIQQWNDWGYYSADEVWPYDNVNGYDDSDVWYIVFVYETPAGEYDFEVWEPRAYLVDGDVFMECSARVYSPDEAPPVGWDDYFVPMVESLTIVDRAALLPNVWGTERGDD